MAVRASNDNLCIPTRERGNEAKTNRQDAATVSAHAKM